MTIGSFIAKNALRNKRRALLSVLSVAASLFLLVTLLVAVRELTVPPEGEGAASRIIVRNRISLANTLPARQRPLIENDLGTRQPNPRARITVPFRLLGSASVHERRERDE